MRKKLTAGLALALLLTLGTAVPAHADTIDFTYTVGSENPIVLICTPFGARLTTALTAEVSATGLYTFSDHYGLDAPSDGRLAIIEGVYNPSGPNNCIGDFDDLNSIILTEGTTYTILGGGFGGSMGTFTYRVTGPGTLSVHGLLTTTTVTASPTEGPRGTATELSASVAAPFGGATPTGSVEFFDGTTSLGSQALSSGTATLSTTALAVGDRSVTAVYSGDTTYGPSTSPAVTVTVTQQTTTTTVATSAATALPGEVVTITAGVTTPGPDAITGTIEFFDGATSLGSAAVAGSTASITMSFLALGSHSITAVYAGDTSSVGSTSATPAVISIAQQSTETSLVATPITAVAGKPVTLAATVSASGSSPVTGSVEFFAGTTSLGTVALEDGKAVLETEALPVGATTISAVYLGSLAHTASTSTAVAVTISAAPSTEPAAKPLAHTGLEVLPLGTAALLLLAAGATALLSLRRRRSA